MKTAKRQKQRPSKYYESASSSEGEMLHQKANVPQDFTQDHRVMMAGKGMSIPNCFTMKAINIGLLQDLGESHRFE